MKLALYLIGVVAACDGSSQPTPVITVPDAPRQTGGCDTCNPWTQTACNFDEKCTVVDDSDCAVGCRPAGAVAIGGACIDDPSGNDVCARGGICDGGFCRALCDTGGSDGPPCAATQTCAPLAAIDALHIPLGACVPGPL